MLKRTTYHSLHFSGALFAIILLSSCADFEQERKQEEIRAAQKKRDEQALKLQEQKRKEQELAKKKRREKQELAEQKRQQELLLTQGPSWEMFDRTCKTFYDSAGHDREAWNVIAMMLYAKIYQKVGLSPADNKTHYQHCLQNIISLIAKAYPGEKGKKGGDLVFKKNIYRLIMRYGHHLSNNDIYHIAVNLNLASSNECSDYSTANAQALLRAYSTPKNQALFNAIDKFWFIRLRAACTLGDIAKADEILNEYSEKCKLEDYIVLICDACSKDKPDMVKFLLPAVNSNEFRSNLAEAFQMMQDLSRLKEHEATIVTHRIGLNKMTEMIKTVGMGGMFAAAIVNSNGRCLPLLLEKFPLDTKSLVFLIEIALKLKDNPNAAGNVLCLIKKFEASRDHADKNHFIDCSTLLIQGNTAVLKELMRAGIQISLASLPAIIADNGPKVLASIDAVMVGKTPLMLASKEMDQAMLAAAAVGNVKVLKKLVQYGGEVNCMDENEKSPLAIAKEKNHQECVAYLESVNAVSSKFQLRNIRREIAAKREKFAANLGIKQYRDDLFRRQLQMLKGLSGKERLLVRTLLQAKIHDNLNLRKLQKLRELANIGGSGAELETILLNKTRLDTTFIYLTFARVQVLKTEDPNRFEVLIYPELTPSSKQMIHGIELRITKNQASWNDQVVYDLIRNVNWSENGKNITVLLDGDVIRILKSPPEIIINFRTPPVSSGRKSVNRARNSRVPRNRKRPDVRNAVNHTLNSGIPRNQGEKPAGTDRP